MSNQFYNYLSNKLTDFFKDSLSVGERFYIEFEEKEKVKSFYESLRKSKTDDILIKEGSYETFYITLNNVKLIVAANGPDVTINYLVKLRNLVIEQKNEWKNTALVVICYDAIDSIYNGFRNLQKKDLPLNANYIANNLINEVNKSSKLSKIDKEICKFFINKKEDDIFNKSLWDYEEILGVIHKGIITPKDYYKIGLFPDEVLNGINDSRSIQTRLKLNNNIFEDVTIIKNSGNSQDQLAKKFDDTGVNLLNKNDWPDTQFKKVKKSQDNFNSKDNILKYCGSTVNGLVHWDKSKSETDRGIQTRYVLIFNDQHVDNVSVEFSFEESIYKSKLKEKYDFVSTKGKTLLVNFPVNDSEVIFKYVEYNHNHKSNYKLFIMVIPFKAEIFESFISTYSIYKSGSKNLKFGISISKEEDKLITFGMGNKRKALSIKLNEDVEYPLSEFYSHQFFISEDSPGWENKTLDFNLVINGVKIPFKVSEESKRNFPDDSVVIWKNKREFKKDFIYTDVKLVQESRSHYILKPFKEFLNLEQEIIENEIFHGIKKGNEIIPVDLELSDDLRLAYQEIIDYYSNIRNIPSLVYLNDTLKELYSNFINLYIKEIDEIAQNDKLVYFPNKMNLLKLGVLKEDKRVLFTSLSPLNIAYQLEVNKQCGSENLQKNILEQLIPINLIPYIFDENDKLYCPIYQKDACEWIIYEESKEVSIGLTNAFIENIVTDKIEQFVSHFDYLFNANNNSPIKLNIINIANDKDIVKGIFNFLNRRINKKKGIIPVEINIYSDAEKSNLVSFFECSNKNQIKDAGFNIKSKYDDENIRLVQDNIVYYKHPENSEDYEYAHISFYKTIHSDSYAFDDMGEIGTGLSLNGLMSSVDSINEHNSYSSGFGTKDILNKDNILIKTVSKLNELVSNSEKQGNSIYSKGRTIIAKPNVLNPKIAKNLYDVSHWVTFINPDFGLEYFDNSDDLIIIHYSDQYSSSTKYDAITVTNKHEQYESIIKEFLNQKSEDIDSDSLKYLIKFFNCINGDWLLRTVKNTTTRSREKLSIISAIKYLFVILDHPEIYWIPISMEEHLRVSGAVGLNMSEGLFSVKTLNTDVVRKANKEGIHSDDLLFVGIRPIYNGSELNTIKLYYHPVEVKFGNNSSNVIEKGLDQLENTAYLLKEQLNQLNDNYEFRNKFFRNFFIRLLLGNEQKLYNNHIWDKKNFEEIFKLKKYLLNDEYEISYDLESEIGIGSLVSFNNDNDFSVIKITEDNKRIIELNGSYAYSGLIDTVDDIYNTIFKYTDFSEEEILYNLDLDSLEHVDLPSEFIDNGDNGGFVGSDDGESDDGGFVGSDDGESDDKPNNGFDLESVRPLIGTQKDSDRKIYWEFGNPMLGNRHMLVQGKSGQGKTYFIQKMIKELSEQGISTVIIDYTDGFKKSKLEDAFLNSLGDKLQYYTVIIDKFPLNPFKNHLIEIDEGEYISEDNFSVAGRFKSTINSVYNLGDKQLNTIYSAVISGLNEYGDKMDLSKLKSILTEENSSSSLSVLSRLIELLDQNPFISNDYDWSVLDNNNGNVIIIQLTGLSKDIQKIISEFILWDLWNYKLSTGSQDKPFVVVLDEAQNLDFDEKSPCSKILTEGRKFGWSGLFATQSIKSLMKSDEISRLSNVEEKIYFHPTDNSFSSIASVFSKDSNEKKEWENKLSKLNKGQCVVYASLSDIKGNLNSPIPVIVNVDEMVNEIDNNVFIRGSDENNLEDESKEKDILGSDNFFNEDESLDSSKLNIHNKDYFKESYEIINSEWKYDFSRPEGKYGRYISFQNGMYYINKYKDHKYHSFGFYRSLDVAKKVRDELMSCNWDLNSISDEFYEKYMNNDYYIRKKDDKEYVLYKYIRGEVKHLGTFDSRKEAEIEKYRLMSDEFEVDYDEEEEFDINIYVKNDVFIVKNKINGEFEVFGTFDNIDDAKDFRTLCIHKNWDVDKVFNIPLENKSVDNDKIIYNDIINIFNSIKLVSEPEIPFPQLNTFNNILNLCDTLYNNDSLDSESIKKILGFKNRHYNYCKSAGEYLGLITKENQNLTLTQLGFNLFSKNEKEMNLGIVKLILEHEPFYNVFKICLENNEIPDSNTIINILKESKLYNVKSDVTLVRRSSTVKHWIGWIFNLIE